MKRRLFCKILLVVVAVLGFSALSGVLFAQGRSEDALARVMEVQERHTDALMATPGVVGTAVGLGQGAQPVVLVLLEHGGVPGIPGQLEDVPVRPLITGKIYALPKPPGTPGGGPGGGGDEEDPPPEEPAPTEKWPRPVKIGISTGHPAITAGTIGCRVTDGINVYALSNNHVYADENQASIGDAVIQPGTFDGGSSPADDIGTLFDSEDILFHEPPFLPGDPLNTIDAAIAISSTSLLDNATPSDGYGTPKSATVEAYLNQKVKKYGRTTGLTKGQVYARNATVDVGYSTGVARFVNQIIITPGGFSAGGDSGSLVVVDGKGRDKADDRKPVGLLFAGNGFVTIANPIDAVLGSFGVTIDGE
ncbi:MAG: Nal1-like putative serine protease [Planctomycetota bacterium]